jgi:hypothetical protein
MSKIAKTVKNRKKPLKFMQKSLAGIIAAALVDLF